jgi:hypothetical protein
MLRKLRLKSGVRRQGVKILLREKDSKMDRAFDLLAGLPGDISLAGREKDRPQIRSTRGEQFVDS